MTTALTNYHAADQSDGSLMKSNYYQHSHINNNNNHHQLLDEQVPAESFSSGATSWGFTDFGRVGPYSRDGSPHATDEVFNAASHIAATILSLMGSVLLIVQSSAQGEPWKIVSFAIYGASLVFLFLCSSLHHALVGPWENFLRMLDYLAIYPLIAGTFTPLCLVFYHHTVIGWAFCCTVWALAILGMFLTACHFQKIPKWFSMTLYVTLGWLGACMSYWLLPALGWSGFGLFALGGVLYTAGGYVYTMEHPNPVPGSFGFHEIWHVAVVLAAASHYFLMYIYVLRADESTPIRQHLYRRHGAAADSSGSY